jgi:hypothetical protein
MRYIAIAVLLSGFCCVSALRGQSDMWCPMAPSTEEYPEDDHEPLYNEGRLHGDKTHIWGDGSHLFGTVDPGLKGDISDIRGMINGVTGATTSVGGDVTMVFGPLDRIDGDLSGLEGCLRGLFGNASGLVGVINELWEIPGFHGFLTTLARPWPNMDAVFSLPPDPGPPPKEILAPVPPPP